MSKTRTPYPPSASPWNQQNLLILWAAQIAFAVFVSAFSGGMLNRKLDQHVSDDGLSNGYYLVYANQPIHKITLIFTIS